MALPDHQPGREEHSVATMWEMAAGSAREEVPALYRDLYMPYTFLHLQLEL